MAQSKALLARYTEVSEHRLGVRGCFAFPASGQETTHVKTVGQTYTN